MFIAVDGIDGAGKTTLVGGLADILNAYAPLITKEPTDDSEWGRRLRASATEGRLPRDRELEFFRKDRVFHVEQVIRPALEAGRWVISDRYVDSTLAFQTDSPEEADTLYQAMLDEILVPDLTIILDCSAEIGLRRVWEARHALSQFEKLQTLMKAEKIYRSRRGANYVHIDAEDSAERTLEDAVIAVTGRARSLGIPIATRSVGYHSGDDRIRLRA